MYLPSLKNKVEPKYNTVLRAHGILPTGERIEPYARNSHRSPSLEDDTERLRSLSHSKYKPTMTSWTKDALHTLVFSDDGHFVLRIRPDQNMPRALPTLWQ